MNNWKIFKKIWNNIIWRMMTSIMLVTPLISIADTPKYDMGYPVISIVDTPNKDDIGYLEALKKAGLGYIFEETYGNWFGPGWWGGDKSSLKPGNKPPIDSMDKIAMRHDFLYLIAEKQGRIYGKYEDFRLSSIADEIAAEEAKKLGNKDPNNWDNPPSPENLAKVDEYLQIMDKAFTVESKFYELNHYSLRLVEDIISQYMTMRLGSFNSILEREEVKKVYLAQRYEKEDLLRYVKSYINGWYREHDIKDILKEVYDPKTPQAENAPDDNDLKQEISLFEIKAEDEYDYMKLRKFGATEKESKDIIELLKKQYVEQDVQNALKIVTEIRIRNELINPKSIESSNNSSFSKDVGYILIGNIDPKWYSQLLRSVFGVVDPYKELQPIILEQRKKMEAMGLRVIYKETPAMWEVKKAITSPNTKALAWFGHGDENIPGLLTNLANEDIVPNDIKVWAQEELSKKIGTPKSWGNLTKEERNIYRLQFDNAHFNLKYVYLHTCYGINNNDLPDVLTTCDGIFRGYKGLAGLKDESVLATIRGGKEDCNDTVYIIPETCTYKYSTWGECNKITKTQTRNVIDQEPMGCEEKEKPILEQECTSVELESDVETSKDVNSNTNKLDHEIGSEDEKSDDETKADDQNKNTIVHGSGGSVSGMFPPGKPFNRMQITYDVSGCSFPKMEDIHDFKTSRHYEGRLGDGTLTLSGTASELSGTTSIALDVSLSAGGERAGKEFHFIAPGSKSFEYSVPIPKDALYGSFRIYMGGSYGNGQFRELVVSGSCTHDGPEGESPKGTEDLVVKLRELKKEVQIGEKKDLVAEISGGRIPYTYAWSGAEGKEQKALFQSNVSGEHTVSLSVTDIDGNTAQDSIKVMVQSPEFEVVGLPKKPLYASKAKLNVRIKNGGKSSFKPIWQSSEPGIEFDPPEGMSTTVTFGRVKKISIWVQVPQPEGGKTLESKQVHTEVVGPQFTLKLDTKEPYIGEEVRANITSPTKLPEETIGWIWSSPQSSNRMEYNDPASEIGFMLKDIKPLKLEAEARVPHWGDVIGTVKGEIRAQEYEVKVNVLGPLGPKPMIWKEGKGLVEVDKEIAVHQNIRLEAKISPQPKDTDLRYEWKLNEGSHFAGGSTGSEVMVNRSQTGTAVATVTLKDKDDNVLGTGSGTFSVTISQQQIDTGKQNDEDQKKAQALLEQGRELWKQGKLQEAIDKVENAQNLVPKDKKIIDTLKAMEKQKKDLDSKLKEAEGLIKQAKLKEAEKILSSAALISDKYSRYKEVLQQLADAKKKIEDEKKKIEKLLKDAKVLEKSGKLDEAAKLLEDGSKQVSDNTQLTQALKVVQEQQADAVKKMTEGQDQWEKGMIDEAIKTLTEAAKIDPSNKDVSKILKSMQLQKKTIDGLLKKSSDLIMDNKFSDAEASLKKASYINDKYTQYKDVLQELADAKKKVEDEEKKIAKLLKDANALEKSGKLDEAAKLLEDGSKEVSDNTQLAKALKAVQEQQADAVNKMAEGQDQWEKGMLDKAVSTLNEALKIDPSNKQIENVLKDIQDQKTIMDDTLITADKLIDQQKFDEAKSVLKKAEGISGNYPPYVEILEKLDVAKKIVEEITQPSTHDINYALGFAGKWNSSYGTMELKVDGVRVIGNYTHDKGRIEARLSEDGKTMKGTWAEAPSYKGSRDAGKMYFKLSSGGKRIEGLWSYGDAVPNKRWDATRITNTKIKAPVIGKGVVDNIDESTKVKPVSVVDNLKGGYWKLVDIQGYLGRECSSNEMSNNYYKHTISGGEEDITMTKIVRKSNETYFSTRVKWKRPPEKMYPKKVIGLPLSIQKLVDTNKYSSSCSIGIDTHDMKCGYTSAGGRIGYLSLKSGKEQSKAETVDWVVKEPTRKEAGEKLAIRVCYGGIQVCGNKEQLGWKYHYIWVPEGTPEPQTNLEPISDKESDTAQDNLDGVTKLPSGQEYNIDRKGSDYKSISLDEANPSLCQNACIKEEKCKAWTYVKPNTIQGPKPKCWLKHSVPKAIISTCCISGIKSHLDLDSNTIRGENAIKTDSQSNGKEIVIGAAGRGSNTLKTIELSIPSGMTEHMKLVITEASELSFNGKADNARIGEVEFYANGKKVIPSQVEVSSNYGRGYTAEQIIDGNREYQYIHIGAKGWASTVKKNGEDWIDFHFSKPEDITKVIITTAPSRPYRLHSFSMRKYGYDKSDVIGSIPSHVQNSVSNTSKTSSKEKHCKKYSDYALRQEKDNKRLGCGYRGDRWNSRYKYHYNWCMKVPDTSAKREYYARNKALKKCKSIMNLKASSKSEDYTKSRKQCRSFKIIKNAGIPGYNKEIINNISLSDCKKSCIERSWCKSVDYEREKKRCYMQNVNQSDVPLKRNYSGNPYDHYSCIHSQLSDTQKENLVNQFKGNLSGTWSGKGTGNFKGWTSNGTFIMNISESGKISGSYTGDDKGRLSGSVSSSGRLNMKSGGGSAGSGRWSGTIKINAYGKLQGSGSWSVDGFKGTWSGRSL